MADDHPREKAGSAPKFTCECGSAISLVLRGEWVIEGERDGYARTRECRDCGARYVTVEYFARRIKRKRAA